MAIYHCSVKIISRDSGRSAVAASAYRSGARLRNEYDGITHDYTNRRRDVVSSAAYRSGDELHSEFDGVTHDFTKKPGIVYSEIMLPENAPDSYKNRETLWNAVEKIEKPKNARLAREVEIALPNELDTDQQIRIVQDYVRENFVARGMCADFSIHSGQKNDDAPNKQDNPHAHIMLTVRPIDADGSWGEKSRKEYILDRYGNRIKLKSGEWKSRKIDSTNWNETATLVKWRENWARTVNTELARLGIDERIDHRSYKAQGINRIPTIHMGVNSISLEKKGIQTEKWRINQEIRERNAEIIKIENRIKEAEKARFQIAEERKSDLEIFKAERRTQGMYPQGAYSPRFTTPPEDIAHQPPADHRQFEKNRKELFNLEKRKMILQEERLKMQAEMAETSGIDARIRGSTSVDEINRKVSNFVANNW